MNTKTFPPPSWPRRGGAALRADGRPSTTSLYGHEASEKAPAPKRVVDPGLRRDDVRGWATGIRQINVIPASLAKPCSAWTAGIQTSFHMRAAPETAPRGVLHSVMAAQAAIHASFHARAASETALPLQTPIARLLFSVIPAKAGIQTSFYTCAIRESASPLQRDLDPGLRRDDVAGWSDATRQFARFINESLAS